MSNENKVSKSGIARIVFGVLDVLAFIFSMPVIFIILLSFRSGNGDLALKMLFLLFYCSYILSAFAFFLNKRWAFLLYCCQFPFRVTLCASCLFIPIEIARLVLTIVIYKKEFWDKTIHYPGFKGSSSGYKSFVLTLSLATLAIPSFFFFVIALLYLRIIPRGVVRFNSIGKNGFLCFIATEVLGFVIAICTFILARRIEDKRAKSIARKASFAAIVLWLIWMALTGLFIWGLTQLY